MCLVIRIKLMTFLVSKNDFTIKKTVATWQQPLSCEKSRKIFLFKIYTCQWLQLFSHCMIEFLNKNNHHYHYTIRVVALKLKHSSPSKRDLGINLIKFLN